MVTATANTNKQCKIAIAKLQRDIEFDDQWHIINSRIDVNCFIEYCFKDDITDSPIKQQPFHKDIQRKFASGKDSLIEVPRSHGKTTQVALWIIWKLGQNPNLRIKYVCQAENKAAERCQYVQNQILHNPKVRAVFPSLVPSTKMEDWSKHKFTVQRSIFSKDCTFEASGILSSATGGRADIIVFDDIIDMRNALLQPAYRQTVKQYYKAVWVNMVEPTTGQKVYICTPYHEDDLTAELKKGTNYDVLSIPIPDDLTPLWADRWGREALLKLKKDIGTIEFARAMHLRVMSDADRIIRPEWIQWYDNQPDLNGYVVAVDPAISTRDNADYSVIIVLGYDYNGNSYIVDMVREHLSFMELLLRLQSVYNQYKPVAVGIETIAYQKAIAEFLTQTTALPIVEINAVKDKITRARQLSIPLQNGKVFLRRGMQDIYEELVSFPFMPHDDIVDALGYAVSLVSRYCIKIDFSNIRTGRNLVKELTPEI